MTNVYITHIVLRIISVINLLLILWVGYYWFTVFFFGSLLFPVIAIILAVSTWLILKKRRREAVYRFKTFVEIITFLSVVLPSLYVMLSKPATPFGHDFNPETFATFAVLIVFAITGWGIVIVGILWLVSVLMTSVYNMIDGPDKLPTRSSRLIGSLLSLVVMVLILLFR